MKNNFTEKILNAFEKFKKNKKLQILLFIGLCLIIIAVYFYLSYKPSKSEGEIESTSSYAEYLEKKLEDNLNSLDGVRDVNVMISLESGFEYIYATDTETKITSGGTLTTSSIVLVSGKPIIEKEIYPKIKGVVVITSSAKEIKVKLNILYAVQTILNISNDKITILN